MRITNQTIASNYNKKLNNTLYQLYKLQDKVTTGRRFDSMAESTSLGVRALQVRRQLSRLDSYEHNIKMTQSTFKAAEDNMMQISANHTTVKEKYAMALNGTNESVDLEAIAKEFERIQEEMLTVLNSKFSDNYLFGGSNVKEAPFSLDTDGKLMYHGERVCDMTSIPADFSYLDVGLGIELDSSGNIAANSAFNTAIVGVELTGVGPGNFYDTLSDMIQSLREGEPTQDLLNTYTDSAKNVGLQVTRMGADDNYLKFMIGRLETEKLNLKERQNLIETVDPAEAIMDLEMQKYVYYAALQIGQNLLQPTLFNFIK